MSANCCEPQTPGDDPPVRRILWLALALNAAMFVIEFAAGVAADSVALEADALDFLGDAVTYGISLLVLGHTLIWRARAALFKASLMAAFGLWVLGAAIHGAVTQTVPEAAVMGAVGLLALAVNVGVAALLFRHRSGDANMRSVWLCSRNDAIGNLAVMGAAAGVFGTGSVWPDLAVAAIMAGLALWASGQILVHARRELIAADLPASAAE